MSVELWWRTVDLDESDNSFKHTFSFTDEIFSIDANLQVIKAKIFEEFSILVWILPQWNVTDQSMMEFYNISRELEDNDPQEIQIHEYEGSQALKGTGLWSDKFLKPLKIKKVTIGSLENPKFENIIDY